MEKQLQRQEAIMEKIRIVIAEDSKLLREGLCLMIKSDDTLEVVAEAADGFEAIAQCVEHTPDMAMLDLSMPKMDGLSAIKEIKRQIPGIKILALTIHDSEDFILECFKCGVQGYCLKDTSQDELLKAIHLVSSGKTFISPSIAGKVMEGYLEGKKHLKERSAWDTLTQREKEILKLVAEGYTSKEIAGMLCNSPKTIERHRANIMGKLSVNNVSQLTAIAIEKGMVNS
jgi:two-component system, NarL family, response regulator NreC